VWAQYYLLLSSHWNAIFNAGGNAFSTIRVFFGSVVKVFSEES